MSKPANTSNSANISKPTEYEAMMIVKDLKETIIEHARVYFGTQYPVDSIYSVVIEISPDYPIYSVIPELKPNHPFVRAQLVVQPQSTGISTPLVLKKTDSPFKVTGVKDALHELLEFLRRALYPVPKVRAGVMWNPEELFMG